MTESTTPEPEDTSEPGEDALSPTAEPNYAQGQTTDPDGAAREEPAGEDYAGSGF